MDFPLTVKNPLTNQIIVSEVEFYLIPQEQVLEKCQQGLLLAQYIGSDYTYAYSQRFRDTVFRDNTLDENLLVGVMPKKEPVIPVEEQKQEEEQKAAQEAQDANQEAGEAQLSP